MEWFLDFHIEKLLIKSPHGLSLFHGHFIARVSPTPPLVTTRGTRNVNLQVSIIYTRYMVCLIGYNVNPLENKYHKWENKYQNGKINTII